MRLLALALLLGCGGGHDAPAGPGECAGFLDHVITLERANGSRVLADVADGSLHDTFVTTCPAALTARQVACAFDANDLAGVDRCVDRHALLARVARADVAAVVADQTPVYSLAARACACTTSDCVLGTSGELSSWERAHDEAPDPPTARLLADYAACADALLH